jgi:hypothetical protein
MKETILFAFQKRERYRIEGVGGLGVCNGLKPNHTTPYIKKWFKTKTILMTNRFFTQTNLDMVITGLKPILNRLVIKIGLSTLTNFKPVFLLKPILNQFFYSNWFFFF